MAPWQVEVEEVGLNINSSEVPLYSMASSSSGVARERGLFVAVLTIAQKHCAFP